jgi:hypothetical protein
MLRGMANVPKLLNDDGSASMGTMLMMSHHAFRRDIARFADALRKVAQGDVSRVEALREEWQYYRGALHGHHEMEDTRVFPHLKAEQSSLGETIDQLSAEHRRIDPLLNRGDRAFAELPKTAAAEAVVSELTRLLETHLATEEAEIVPFLRGAKEFPAPATDAEAEMHAQGIAWSMHGIANEVLDQVYVLLPEALASRLTAARGAYNARSARIWGSVRAGEALTPIPDP